jgi:hypothetical protein
LRKNENEDDDKGLFYTYPHFVIKKIEIRNSQCDEYVFYCIPGGTIVSEERDAFVFTPEDTFFLMMKVA